MSVELEEGSSPRPEETVEKQDSALEADGLAPVDGQAAWKFLIAATIVEAALWAFPLSFGVFQNYYSELPEFRGDQNIPVIGVMPSSVFYLGAIFVTPLIQKFPGWQRPMIAAGIAICILGLVCASFANSVPQLIATQGLMFGVGFLVLYVPLISLLNEWFVRHRGLAYGILYGGAGASGIAYPFILQASLSHWGYRTTLRGCAVGQAVFAVAAIPFLKCRLPASNRGMFRQIDTSFVRKPLFYVYALSNLFQGFAFFIPGLWLPSFASLLGYSQAQGALLLALNNVAQVLGQVAFGVVSDRSENVLGLVFASSFVSAVVAVTLWGLARSLAPLVVFALVYGLFSGGFVVLWPRFGTALTEDPRTVYNVMAFGKGIGMLATGPLSARLLDRPIVPAGYGLGRYEALIAFMGAFMFASSLGVAGWPLKKRRERR